MHTGALKLRVNLKIMCVFNTPMFNNSDEKITSTQVSSVVEKINP